MNDERWSERKIGWWLWACSSSFLDWTFTEFHLDICWNSVGMIFHQEEKYLLWQLVFIALDEVFHPPWINCLVYLHLAVPAWWEFASKGINVSRFTPWCHFLSLHLYIWPLLSLTSFCLSFVFLYIWIVFFSFFPHIALLLPLLLSLYLSLRLQHSGMKLIGEVSKMQIVWVG